jgi:LuxR family maltose regulon positive regulatory protein
LKFVACGLTNKQIADRFNISIHTVKSHIESIFRKLNAHSKVQAIVLSIAQGWIDVSEII